LGLGASAEGGDQRAAGRGLGGGRTSQWGGAAGDEETNGEELSGGEEHELVEKEVPGREERRRQDLPGGEESRPRDLLPGEERSRRDLLPGRVAASQGGRDEHEQARDFLSPFSPLSFSPAQLSFPCAPAFPAPKALRARSLARGVNISCALAPIARLTRLRAA